MADTFVQVATDGAGKKLQSFSNTVNGATDIHSSGVTLVNEIGVPITGTLFRDLIVAQRFTALSDSLADGISSFWTQTTANGGTVISATGEGQLRTSTATNGSAAIQSPAQPYHPGQVNWVHSTARFADTGVAGNIRRIGMFTLSGGVPQEGFYFELDGTTLYACYAKAGVATRTASTAWSRVAEVPFVLDANYHSFEIRYAANSIWYYVDHVLRHAVSGTATPLTTTITLPIAIQNIKTSGASDVLLAVRNIGNGRFGMPGSVVIETGLFAGEALSVGGGTPHDSVDSGNPQKIGGRAQATAPTAVADGDRVNGWFSPNGAQVVVDRRDLGRTPVSIVYSLTNPATADTLVTGSRSIGGAAATSAATFAASAGKTFRITGVTVSTRTTTAAVPWATVTLRMNPSGAAVVGSPAQAQVTVGGTAAVIGNTGNTNFPLLEGFEISGTQQVGISLANNVATNVVSISVVGFEY